MNVSILEGALPLVLIGLAVLGLIALALLRPWKWSLVILLGCAVVTAGIWYFVEKVWRPFPDPLDWVVLAWTWALLGAVALAVAQLFRKRWYAPVLAIVVAAGALTAINRSYGYYPDVGTALGVKRHELTDFQGGRRATVEMPAGGYLLDVWKPPAGMAAKGTLSKLTVPGAESRFKGRQGFVYLPPAYQATPRPVLPVLVVLSGQPGAPQMWIDGGQIVEMMDKFAAAHQGLAPVVLLPDVLGGELANPGCVDSSRGKLETFLAKDVPAWVREHLQVTTDPKGWAIGGLSFGGTCATQLALRAPDVYGRFITLSGDRELELHDRDEAVRELFDGDLAAYAAHNPPDILRAKRFPGTAARLVVGRDDGSCTTNMRTLAGELRAAGVDVDMLELPGGHSWSVWRPGLEQSLPWLARQTRLAPQ